jgi:hypothetical protein
MAPGSKSGPALFLGLELATDQLRASIVDESLELVGVECVDFDTELSEYQCVPSSQSSMNLAFLVMSDPPSFSYSPRLPDYSCNFTIRHVYFSGANR